jgi:hypothetical protein
MSDYETWRAEVRTHLETHLLIVTDGNQQFALLYRPAVDDASSRRIPAVVYAGFASAAGAALAREDVICQFLDNQQPYGPSDVTSADFDKMAAQRP